ncbi:hypothetical protein ABT382_38020, partial [Streptomyces pharetrae]
MTCAVCQVRMIISRSRSSAAMVEGRIRESANFMSDQLSLAVVTNDIYTQEDAAFLRAPGHPPPQPLRGHRGAGAARP